METIPLKVQKLIKYGKQQLLNKGVVSNAKTIRDIIEDIKQTKSVEEIDTTTQDNINMYKTMDLQNCILNGYDTLATDEEYLEAELILQHKYKLIMGGN